MTFCPDLKSMEHAIWQGNLVGCFLQENLLERTFELDKKDMRRQFQEMSAKMHLSKRQYFSHAQKFFLLGLIHGPSVFLRGIWGLGIQAS